MENLLVKKVMRFGILGIAVSLCIWFFRSECFVKFLNVWNAIKYMSLDEIAESQYSIPVIIFCIVGLFITVFLIFMLPALHGRSVWKKYNGGHNL